MIRNADYVMNLIVDPQNLAKKAQVGVDLTIGKISQITRKAVEASHFMEALLLGGGLDSLAGDIDKSYGFVYNDASGLKATYGCYKPVEITLYQGHNMYFLDQGVYSITFDQGLKPLPPNNTAFIYQRSTLGRNGVLLRSSVFDPGFETPDIGAILEVWRPIFIEEHARVAQIVIYENEPVPEAMLYSGQYQGSKDYKG